MDYFRTSHYNCLFIAIYKFHIEIKFSNARAENLAKLEIQSCVKTVLWENEGEFDWEENNWEFRFGKIALGMTGLKKRIVFGKFELGKMSGNLIIIFILAHILFRDSVNTV